MNLAKGRLSLLLCVYLLLISCFGGPALVNEYVKDAILLNINAAVDLNYYNDQSHPIVLALFELSDPNEFKQRLISKENVGNLLNSTSDDKGVVSQLKITLHPGHKKSIRIDKVENARYLAVVAGVYDPKNINDYVRLYEIDIYKTKTLFGDNSRLQKISIDIDLGREGFEKHKVETSAKL